MGFHGEFHILVLDIKYCIKIAVHVLRLFVAVLTLLVCCSVVQKGPDQCNEAARFRAAVTR